MSPNEFKKVLAARQQRKKVEPQSELVEVTDQSLEQALSARVSSESTETEAEAAVRPEVSAATTESLPTEKKRGRPATGKRSDDAWIGRTYYIKKETDMDVEEALLKLRRQGKDIDKSELVDFLLGAWVKWHQGENLEIQLGEVSPIQKSRNS